MNIRELLDEMENRNLYTERKELIRELTREDVSDTYYSSYEASTYEEDRLYKLNEYLVNQVRVVDKFFPICTDNGNLDIDVKFLDDSLEFTMIEGV